MKKILLTLLSFVAFSGVYAQSLSLVLSNNRGEELSVIEHNGEFSVNMKDFGSMIVSDFHFKVKNNTDKSGSVKTQDIVYLNAAAEALKDFDICAEVCTQGGFGAFEAFNIKANDVYPGAGDVTDEFKALHAQNFSTSGVISEPAKYRLDFKFSGDNTVSSFIMNVIPAGSSISSVSGNSSLNVYQNGSDVVAEYSFADAAERYISVYNIAGEVVAKVKLIGESGTEVLPVSLNKGVYIYSLEEGRKSVKSHKFIVK